MGLITAVCIVYCVVILHREVAHRCKVMSYEVKLLDLYVAVEREQARRIGVVDGGGENEQGSNGGGENEQGSNGKAWRWPWRWP